MIPKRIMTTPNSSTRGEGNYKGSKNNGKSPIRPESFDDQHTLLTDHSNNFQD